MSESEIFVNGLWKVTYNPKNNKNLGNATDLKDTMEKNIKMCLKND